MILIRLNFLQSIRFNCAQGVNNVKKKSFPSPNSQVFAGFFNF